MPGPVVTAVIPCHDHARWVGGAMASVAAQGYPVAGLVVVDDGSADGSLRAALDTLDGPREATPRGGPPGGASRWLGTLGRLPVTVFRFPQAVGPAAARNHAVRAAWGDTDLFAFLDSDDLYHPDKVARSVAVFLDAPGQVGAVYSDYSTLNPETRLVVREYKEPFCRRRLLAECLPNMDSLVSRQALARCGLLDEGLRTCEDYDLWVRLSEHFLVVHLPEDLLTIRVGGHSSTATVAAADWVGNRRRVFEKAEARLAAAWAGGGS